MFHFVYINLLIFGEGTPYFNVNLPVKKELEVVKKTCSTIYFIYRTENYWNFLFTQNSPSEIVKISLKKRAFSLSNGYLYLRILKDFLVTEDLRILICYGMLQFFLDTISEIYTVSRGIRLGWTA